MSKKSSIKEFTQSLMALHYVAEHYAKNGQIYSAMRTTSSARNLIGEMQERFHYAASLSGGMITQTFKLPADQFEKDNIVVKPEMVREMVAYLSQADAYFVELEAQVKAEYKSMYDQLSIKRVKMKGSNALDNMVLSPEGYFAFNGPSNTTIQEYTIDKDPKNNEYVIILSPMSVIVETGPTIEDSLRNYPERLKSVHQVLAPSDFDKKTAFVIAAEKYMDEYRRLLFR